MGYDGIQSAQSATKGLSKISVLFVCMGNICRSPTAEGVFRHTVEKRKLLDKITIDSAGTHAYHIGEQPDARSQTTALNKGIDLSTQRARKASTEDFTKFDYIIAMDQANYDHLKIIRDQPKHSNTHVRENETKNANESNLHLFMEFTSDWNNTEVPDPYYGDGDGFEKVFDMVKSASEGLLQHIILNDLK